MDRKEYEEKLKKIQEQHLEQVWNNNFKPCAHDFCPQCHWTWVKYDWIPCVHMLHCSCPKCSPRC